MNDAGWGEAREAMARYDVSPATESDEESPWISIATETNHSEKSIAVTRVIWQTICSNAIARS